MLSSTITNDCSVSRRDVKNYFLQLLTIHKVLHFKITEQIKKIEDQNVATLISNINKYYKISFADAYAKNEHMGKEIFLEILHCNLYTNGTPTKFPQIETYPYLNDNMVHDTNIDINDYKKKIIKYYRDYTVPVSFDGETINQQCPDTIGEFVDRKTMCVNFIAVTDFYKSYILRACKLTSDKLLKAIMKEDFYKPETSFTFNNKYNVEKERLDKYLIEIGYNSQSLVNDVAREIGNNLKTDKFLTLDGTTIEQTYLNQYKFKENKMQNFMLIVKNNQRKIIEKHLMTYLTNIASDLRHMYYLPKAGFILPAVLNTEFIRTKMHLFPTLDKEKYNEQINKYNRRNPSSTLDNLIKNMPMEHNLNYFRPQRSNNQTYKNYNTNGKSHHNLPQIEVTDVRARNIWSLRNGNLKPSDISRPQSARNYVEEKQVPISSRSN